MPCTSIRSRPCGLRAGKRAFGIFDIVEDGEAAPIIGLAIQRRADVARRALQQADAQPCLELLDRPGSRSSAAGRCRGRLVKLRRSTIRVNTRIASNRSMRLLFVRSNSDADLWLIISGCAKGKSSLSAARSRRETREKANVMTKESGQSRDRDRCLAGHRRGHRRAARQRRLHGRHQLRRQRRPRPRRWPRKIEQAGGRAADRAGGRQRSRRGAPHVRRGGGGVRRRRRAGQQCRHHAAGARIADSDDALFDRQIAINLKGTFNTLREAARRLRDGGRIINFSSSVVGLLQPDLRRLCRHQGRRSRR